MITYLDSIRAVGNFLAAQILSIMKEQSHFFVMLLLLFASLLSIAQPIGYTPVKSGSIVQDKNFYLLTLLQQSEVAKSLQANEELTKLQKSKISNIKSAISDCADVVCIAKAFKWTYSEIATISKTLKEEMKKNSSLQQMVANHLRSSKSYVLFDDLKDAELLVKAWEICANGMNHSISVYGQAKEANYPKIDSISYNIQSKSFQETLTFWATDVLSQTDETSDFFGVVLDYTLSLLYLNHRDEAARYEPMALLENKAAIDYIPTINWDEYPYASILVLGIGSEIYGVKLTPGGKLNVRVAARQFKEGLAPLLIVSGGHVHPYRTTSCEAINMKEELIAKYGIDEKHILIDPHARHTTTNLRNASRLLFSYGTKTDKPSLVTSNPSHRAYTESQRFLDRNLKELGYLPMSMKERLNSTTMVFLPLEISFQQNPLEPLDP